MDIPQPLHRLNIRLNPLSGAFCAAEWQPSRLVRLVPQVRLPFARLQYYMQRHPLHVTYIPYQTMTYQTRPDQITPDQTIPLYYIALHRITLHYITLHYITLHTLPYITLHCIALHYTTLHYITLH